MTGSKQFLYEKLSDSIRHLIHKGTLKPGDKLPSIRHFSAQQQVSMPTVLQAYRLLEDQQLIEASPQSGFFVKAQPNIAKPEPEKTRHHLKSRPVTTTQLIIDCIESITNTGFVPLSSAEASHELMPAAQLAKSLSNVSRQYRHRTQVYTHPAGEPELRREISKRLFSVGVTAAPDRLLITNGCTEAVALCLRVVCKPGDTVAVESPCYHGTLLLLASLQLKALEIPTYQTSGISVSHLESALKLPHVKACILTANYQNPLGYLIPDDNKQKIAELAAKYQCPLIEDDTFGDCSHHNQRPRPIKHFDKKNHVMYCSSFSKTLSSGYRVGWVYTDHWHDKLLHLKLANSISSASPTQLAIAHFLKNGNYDKHLRKLKRQLSQQCNLMIQEVYKHFLPDCKISQPSGGIFLWVELPETVDTLAVFHKAREQKIGISPGSIFSASGKYRHCMRLSCGYPWNKSIESALKTVGKILIGQK